MRIEAVVLSALTALALGSCGGSSAGAECTDGIDNDNDGLFDSADSGCEFNDGQAETPDPTECNDGIDNDDDGKVDGDDVACTVAGATSETEPEGECNDGLDNDGDFLADYPQDPGCESPVDADESNPPQCGDGEDNDGDNKPDYPNDPGCDSTEDDDETDPDPLPICGDGSDNDSDGQSDYPNDQGCTAASDTSELDDCVSGVSVTGHAGGSVQGNTTDAEARLAAPDGCETSGSSAISPELVYGFVLDRGDLSQLVFDTEGSGLDTVLYVRVDDCATSSTLAMCNDDALGTASQVVVNSPAAGNYFVVVDGKSNFGGAFELNISGTIAAGGACDPDDDDFTCDVGHSCSSGSCVAD